MSNKEENICCPEFKPEKWDDKVLEWENKNFVKSEVKTFFYMPINFSSVMKRLDKLINFSSINQEEMISLSEHVSKWKMNIYIAIDKEVEGIENVKFTGKYYSKVYEGKFQDTGKWCKDYESHLEKKNLKVSKMYMWYTTCPKCAKKYGKNYVPIIGELKD
ncbi:MAG: hypothetical protein RBR79_00095 [Bacteroidales bacterium]|jgi:hypothetical protein|nr:hypothetical protein [Bacteroidales bacterium]